MLVVRHGTTEWSTAGRHTGRTDVDLTPEGEAEATTLGPLLRQRLGDAVAQVHSSPLQRALRTAMLALPGTPVAIDARLVELDYGDYEGMTTAEIQAKVPEWDLFTHECPAGETVEQVAARCDSFIADLGPGAHVVFAHGHLSRILAVRLLGWTPSTAAFLYNDTASIGAVRDRRGTRVLDAWNCRAVVSRRA